MLYPVAIVYNELEQLVSVCCISHNGFSFRQLFAGKDFNSYYLEEYSKRLNGDDTNFLAALRHKETGTFAFPDKQKEVQPSVSFFVNRIK